MGPRLQAQLLIISAVALAAPFASLGQQVDGEHRGVYPLRGPRYTYEQWMQRCSGDPQVKWVVDFVQFQRANRWNPDAKYLAYYCPDKHQSEGRGTCQGLGDRVRGILYLARIAYRSKRVFLINQVHPARMEEFLAPSGIFDWRVGNTTLNPEWNSQVQWWQMLVDQSLYDRPEKTVFIETNEPIEKPIPGGPDVQLMGNATHCLFHSLFMPSERTSKTAEEQMTRIGLDPTRSYAAVHLRLGGSVGEVDPIWSLENALPTLLSSIKCARNLAQSNGLTGDQAVHKIVLLTDHMKLRQFIAEGFLTDVVATAIVPYHFDMANRNLDGLFNTMADLVMLSHASCLIMHQSGFGRIALWSSGTSCTLHIDSCKHYWEEAGRSKLMHHRKALGILQPAGTQRSNDPMDQAALQSGLAKLRAWWGDGQEEGQPVRPAQLTPAERQAVKQHLNQMYNTHNQTSSYGSIDAAAKS